MKTLESRFGTAWIDRDSTLIESLKVVETGAGTVQICIGVWGECDRYGSITSHELLLELDTMAAGALAEKLAAVALNIGKNKAGVKLANPNGTPFD